MATAWASYSAVRWFEAKGHVLGAAASHRFNSWIDKSEVAGTAEAIADALDPDPWQRLSAGWGTQGERLSDWAFQEVQRVAARLAPRRIEPALVIAWSAWRRAHPAAARQAHLKRQLQL